MEIEEYKAEMHEINKLSEGITSLERTRGRLLQELYRKYKIEEIYNDFDEQVGFSNIDDKRITKIIYLTAEEAIRAQ